MLKTFLTFLGFTTLLAFAQPCPTGVSFEITPMVTEGEYTLSVTTETGSIGITGFSISLTGGTMPSYTDQTSIPFVLPEIITLDPCSDYTFNVSFLMQCTDASPTSIDVEVSTGGGGGEITSILTSCGTYTFTSSDADIPPTSVWSFGDGEYETAGVTTSHSYTSNGVYVITVNDPDDPLFCSEYEVVTVTGLPESEISSTTNCTDNIALLSASGDAIWIYAWTFGDGETSSDQSTSHTYADAGTYTVTLTVTDGAGCSSITTKTITVGPLALDYTVSNRCLGETFIPDWVPSGADSYAWVMGDDPETTYDVQYPIHIYTLDPGVSSQIFITTLTIVKDGCTSVHSESVIVYRNPELSILATNVLCDPMAYNFTPTASYYTDLIWEIEDVDYPAIDGEEMYYLYPTAGIKNVYLKAVNGSCEAILLEQVTISDGLSVSIDGIDNFCSGSYTTLEAVVIGGGGSYEYNWLKDGISVGTSDILIVIEADEYELTVTETGCESFASASSTITELVLPTIGTITTTDVDCPDAANGTYTINFDPDPVDGYRINGGDILTDPIFTGTDLSVGTHYITIGHPLNPSCTFVEEISIGYDGPVLDITATPISCVDGGTFEATLSETDATISSIEWHLTEGMILIPGETSTTYLDVPGGFYTAIATLSNGCIVHSPSIQMTLPHIGATLNNTYVCEDGGTTLVEVIPTIDPGSGIFTFSWSTGAAGSATSLSTGDYDVEITETGSGCVYTKPVHITAVDPLVVTASTTLIGCADVDGEITVKGSVAIFVSGGSGDFDYTWSGIDHTSPLLEDIIIASTYTVTVTDVTYSCTQDITVSITNSPSFTVNVTVLDCGAEATVTPAETPIVTYQWFSTTTGDLVATSATGIAPPLAPDNYELKVIDSYGCSASTLFTLTAPVVAVLDIEFKFKFGPKELPDEEDEPIDENLMEEMQIAADQLLNQLSDCIIHQSEQVSFDFDAICLNPETFHDEVRFRYAIKQQQYTLYYYDRAGNLTKTVPPEGVEFLNGDQVNKIINYRDYYPGKTHFVDGLPVPDPVPPTPTVWLPEHRLTTTYEYNSLHELISQNTPDGGRANYIYDSNKRLRFSQSARQEALGLFSYTKYDDLGRPTEAGESNSTDYTLDFTDQLTAINFEAADNEFFPIIGNKEVMYTVYSAPSSVDYYGQAQTYTQNRVSYVIKDEDGDFTTTADQFKTHYSYDVHGNVNWMVQEDPVIGKNYVAYEYDLISGNVKEVKYNEKRADKFFHRYKYDSDNRLVTAETSRDHVLWDKDAEYDYYLHGPLRRKNIGEDNIQAEDYTYTIQGWLKAINNTGSNTDDPGQDGIGASAFMKDVFGMTLGYFSGDFTRGDADGTNIFANKNIYGSNGTTNATPDLYNGNISSWASRTNTGNLTPDGVTLETASKTHLSVYQYDDLQRIRFSKYLTDIGTDGTSFTESITNQFATNYTFDRNGNLHTLERHGQDGVVIDDLVYAYNEGSGDNTTKQKNQLTYVNDLIAIETGTSLLKQHDYNYDESGNLLQDKGFEMLGDPLEEHEVILDIEWNVAGKVKQITKTISGPQIDRIGHVLFHYDAMGNRIGKEYIEDILEPEIVDITRYTLDASGNTMGIYKIAVESNTVDDVTIYTAELKLLEHPIYGSSRIGMNTEPIVLQTWEFTEGMSPDYTYDEDGTHTISELSNWIMAGIKTDVLNQAGATQSEICHCQIKQTAFDYDTGTELYTYDHSGAALAQTYYGQIDNGLAIGETTEGELDLYAVNIDNYLGTTNQCLVFNKDNEPIKGTEDINQIESQTKPIISQVTGNENYYRLFILDENKHPKSYLINTNAQGWGAIDEHKGEVEGLPMSINETYDYGRHMAVFEDHINDRSVVYMTRYIPEESEEDCLGKTQLVAYEYSSDLSAEPIETILTEVLGKDKKGEGELQLSEDGTHLVYYNRTENISGFAHKTIQINVFELGGDKTTVIGTKIVSRTFNEGDGDPDYMHYGTYGKASVDFTNGGNLLFSQNGIFEENEADDILQDGSHKQVHYYNTIDGSISYTSAEGTNQYNEVRRGKNKLFYVPTEQESHTLNEITTTGELPFPVTELPIIWAEEGFVLISSLPTQPHKLIGDEEAEIFTRLVGAKQYELNDHLGNVRAVVSDRRGYVSIAGDLSITNEPELVAWTDYYAYGMRMAGRSESTSFYRYGFNGAEKDDEVKGEGNSYYMPFRRYDARIARWTAVDPVVHEYQSPYNAFDGNPIYYNDPSGGDSQDHWIIGEDGSATKVGDQGGSDYQLFTIGSTEYKDENGNSYWKGGETFVYVGGNRAGIDFFSGQASGRGVVSTINLWEGFTDENRSFYGQNYSTWDLQARKNIRDSGLDLPLSKNMITAEANLVPREGQIWSNSDYKRFIRAKYGFVGDDGLSWLAAYMMETDVLEAAYWMILAGGGYGVYGTSKVFNYVPRFPQKFCFIGGTLIMTLEGVKNIEDIEIGDMVWSYNEKLKITELNVVESVFVKEGVLSLCRLLVNDQLILVTSDHKFYSSGNWISAMDLKNGDELMFFEDSINYLVENNSQFDSLVKVYNFSVYDNHNYYVSELGILVHNDCGKGWIKKSLYSKLLRKDDALVESFENALDQGAVNGGGGSAGIKRLSGKGMKIAGEWYQYELKTVPGSTYGNHRLYGNYVEWTNQNGVKMKQVVFEVYKKSH